MTGHFSSYPGSVEAKRMPTKSAMETALGFMRTAAERADNSARFVSGEGEAAEIYSDAAKCVAYALDHFHGVAQAEPITHRWRSFGAHTWIYDPEPEWLEDHKFEVEWEPVYGAPQPATDAQGAVSCGVTDQDKIETLQKLVAEYQASTIAGAKADVTAHGMPGAGARSPVNRGAVLDLLSNAYNEGFGEGMREHTSSKGGWPWNARKQKYGALLDKALAISSTKSGGAAPSQPFSQCEQCWQPATCKKYGCSASAYTSTGRDTP